VAAAAVSDNLAAAADIPQQLAVQVVVVTVL
jgi:hypothetical protein